MANIVTVYQAPTEHTAPLAHWFIISEVRKAYLNRLSMSKNLQNMKIKLLSCSIFAQSAKSQLLTCLRLCNNSRNTGEEIRLTRVQAEHH